MTTAADIIKLALLDSGVIGQGQTASANDTNNALTRMNWVLEQWARKNQIKTRRHLSLPPLKTLQNSGRFLICRCVSALSPAKSLSFHEEKPHLGEEARLEKSSGGRIDIAAYF